MWVNYRQQIYI